MDNISLSSNSSKDVVMSKFGGTNVPPIAGSNATSVEDLLKDMAAKYAVMSDEAVLEFIENEISKTNASDTQSLRVLYDLKKVVEFKQQSTASTDQSEIDALADEMHSYVEQINQSMESNPSIFHRIHDAQNPAFMRLFVNTELRKIGYLMAKNKIDRAQNLQKLGDRLSELMNKIVKLQDAYSTKLNEMQKADALNSRHPTAIITLAQLPDPLFSMGEDGEGKPIYVTKADLEKEMVELSKALCLFLPDGSEHPDGVIASSVTQLASSETVPPLITMLTSKGQLIAQEASKVTQEVTLLQANIKEYDKPFDSYLRTLERFYS